MKTGNRNYIVSVILTLFNSREFYRRALDSILNQSFRDIEIIIVDDGSTDGTESDLLPGIRHLENVKYLRHSNRKHALSLNSGILISSGKFITFLDSDDEYKPEHIQQRINYFNENIYIDLISTGADIIGKEEDMYVPDANDLNRLIHIKDCIMLGTLFGKREVFLDLKGFRDIYSHDSDFFKRAEEIFRTAFLESDTYVYYRNNPESVLAKLKKSIHDK
ncbi:MAG: glycosyltransferase family 2 protein [Bacteroidetes bacterium]|nr:glycosyltransferase family 2 protein [Bacteroidota bacterium]